MCLAECRKTSSPTVFPGANFASLASCSLSIRNQGYTLTADGLRSLVLYRAEEWYAGLAFVCGRAARFFRDDNLALHFAGIIECLRRCQAPSSLSWQPPLFVQDVATLRAMLIAPSNVFDDGWSSATTLPLASTLAGGHGRGATVASALIASLRRDRALELADPRKRATDSTAARALLARVPVVDERLCSSPPALLVSVSASSDYHAFTGALYLDTRSFKTWARAYAASPAHCAAGIFSATIGLSVEREYRNMEHLGLSHPPPFTASYAKLAANNLRLVAVFGMHRGIAGPQLVAATPNHLFCGVFTALQPNGKALPAARDIVSSDENMRAHIRAIICFSLQLYVPLEKDAFARQKLCSQLEADECVNPSLMLEDGIAVSTLFQITDYSGE